MCEEGKKKKTEGMTIRKKKGLNTEGNRTGRKKEKKGKEEKGERKEERNRRM